MGLLALMASWPFVFPFHTKPIASFGAEWWAGALGFAAAIIGLSATRNRLLLPQSLLIPTVLLVVLLVQFPAGRLEFRQFGILCAAYLLWASLILILGRQLADAVGLKCIIDVVATAFLIGAFASATVAFTQWLGISNRVPFVLSDFGGSIFGNFGQRNHHAHYCWVGISSTFYLYGRKKLQEGTFWSLVVFICFGSILGGSRSIFLYLLTLVAAIAWAHHKTPEVAASNLLARGFILLPVVLLLNLFGSWATPLLPELWAWLTALIPSLDAGVIQPGGYSMPAARIIYEVSGPSIRMATLNTAWTAFTQHIWLGNGVGNYAWASFVAAGSSNGTEQFIVMEHAHNIIFQLLVEYGAPATLAVSLLLLFWTKRFLAHKWELEHFLIASILGFCGIHSLLEYPLWYSYFLGPTALLLGAADSGKFFVLVGNRIVGYLVLVAITGVLMLGSLRIDYNKIEAAYNFPLAAHLDPKQAWRISMDNLLKLHKESLLSPWVLMAFVNLSKPSEELANERAELCERGIRFSAVRSLATRCVIQLEIAGQTAEAQKLESKILRAFPHERQETINELEMWAESFPEIKAQRVNRKQE